MHVNRILACALIAGGTAGCCLLPQDTLPPDIGETAVVVAEGHSLKETVIFAATRRRWMPQEIDGTTVRCTLVQRGHKVVVDFRLLDDRHYAIHMVESNIPARKVSQWVANLQRDIARYAVR
ncbi:MAG TPA: hypothetical protein DD637_00425 [Verrucomicrobia bacterium]|nr:hypothetical protein [Verrucomicrobiota bacterium]